MAKLNLKSLNLKKTFTNPKIISLIIVILVVFVGGFILNRLMGGGIMHENLDNINKPQLTYYYMEQCGHCQKFSTEWDLFYDNNNNNSNFNCNKIEAQEKDPSIAIKGYPTIILYKPDGTEIEFKEERTAKKLESFLKENGINLD